MPLSGQHLDINNPRFGLFSAEDEGEALGVQVDTANIKELWAAISLGFERFEPLIAIKDPNTVDHCIVIEGHHVIFAPSSRQSCRIESGKPTQLNCPIFSGRLSYPLSDSALQLNAPTGCAIVL